jgi:hypothetical protein
LKRLHASVKEKERQYNKVEDPESEEEDEEEEEKIREKKEPEEKKKEYFGQFKRSKSTRTHLVPKIEDNFEGKVKSGEEVARTIIKHYSYLDNDILHEQYKKSGQENDRLELNLSNPYFFQPKLHAILTR